MNNQTSPFSEFGVVFNRQVQLINVIKAGQQRYKNESPFLVINRPEKSVRN